MPAPTSTAKLMPLGRRGSGPLRDRGTRRARELTSGEVAPKRNDREDVDPKTGACRHSKAGRDGACARCGRHLHGFARVGRPKPAALASSGSLLPVGTHRRVDGDKLSRPPRLDVGRTPSEDIPTRPDLDIQATELLKGRIATHEEIRAWIAAQHDEFFTAERMRRIMRRGGRTDQPLRAYIRARVYMLNPSVKKRIVVVDGDDEILKCRVRREDIAAVLGMEPNAVSRIWTSAMDPSRSAVVLLAGKEPFAAAELDEFGYKAVGMCDDWYIATADPSHYLHRSWYRQPKPLKPLTTEQREQLAFTRTSHVELVTAGFQLVEE